MSVTHLPARTGRLNASLTSAVTLVRKIARRPTGLFGMLVVVGLILVAIFAPLIAPYGPAEQDISHRLEGPTRAHLLGTDHLGRDLLSRLIYGSRVALGMAIPAVLMAMILGMGLGLMAGYLGGRTDNTVLVLLDSFQAFPTVILVLALLALLGPSLRNVILVIAITWAPGYARVTRAQVLSVKESVFVKVGRSLGAGDLRIVGIHILPNILAPLVILVAMDLPAAITTEAGLSFLGLGVRPPTPSWGVILADGFSRIRTSAWPVLWACLVLMISTLGFTLLGEALRDTLDPRLSGMHRT